MNLNIRSNCLRRQLWALGLASSLGIGAADGVAFATTNLIDSFSPVSSFAGGGFDILDENGVAGSDGVTDVIISVTTAGGGTVDGVTGEATWDVSNTGIRSSESFSGAVTTNNPGTRLVTTLTFQLASHLSVLTEDFEVDFSSLNTAGIGWESSVIQFLDSSGNPFSPITEPAPYLSYAPIGGVGLTGNFHADSVATVNGVGTANTSTGTNGPNNNLTALPGGNLDAVESGILAGTRIGGFRVTTYFEDVRGTGNANTAFTSTLNEVNISGETIPEPGSGLLCLIGLGGGVFPPARGG